ncbi:LanA [Bugula neritina]|uniref:LanA n=1 Tax=Bugula neritina TaxID=10212 RepID=A0A7J7K2U5_BUGNE|nr:LanA [Bugula neritina]
MIPTNDVQRITSDLELLNPYDLSGRYISECTGENFFIDAEQGQISPFCRSSIFSVTTEYNNGALSCDCDALGSESFQCSEFGGQCRCKPNVIGRTCTACAHNYYGFPDCKPCNCPATCNAVTGACECPKRTTGPQCDQCVPQTYGYDRTIGCMDCKCQPEGVLNGNLSCDLDTGVCDCKPNVVGRRCDACMNGHWNYPSCDSCDCDPAGTTEIICDSETSQCSCKLNTGGDTCGTCQPGTYNLEARNHEGCTKCFCFGITFSCQSSSMLKAKVMNMSGFDLINANGTAEIVGNDSIVTAKLNDSAAQQIAMYWLAPEVYLGNKLTSYGGQIRYSVSNQGVTPGVKPNLTQLPGPDVQISGKGLVLVYTLLSPILDEEISVDIIESSWRHAASSDMVTREQLMKVLSAVDEILIKANYYTNIPKSL